MFAQGEGTNDEFELMASAVASRAFLLLGASNILMLSTSADSDDGA